jgi:hypothetical protein
MLGLGGPSTLKMPDNPHSARASAEPRTAVRVIDFLETLKEDVVLPAAHTQKYLSQQRKLAEMLGVDGGFASRPERHLVGGNVINDIEDGKSPVSGRRTPGAKAAKNGAMGNSSSSRACPRATDSSA